MFEYLIAILGLGALCATWVLLQQRLGTLDPEPDEKTANIRCGGCSGCGTQKCN